MNVEDLKKYSLCKKDYTNKNWIKIFEKGKFYKTWENFGGVNIFAENTELSETRSFSPTMDGTFRPVFYDYFYTVEEMRDIKIELIL